MVIMMMTISLLKNESIFGDNWFAVVVYELMIPWLYTNKHALCKTRSLRHQTPAQFIPLTNLRTMSLQSRILHRGTQRKVKSLYVLRIFYGQ